MTNALAATLAVANVSNLEVAWTYHTGDVADGSKTPVKSGFEAPPIMVDGALYFSTPYNRVIALDPATGKERWAFDPKIAAHKTRRRARRIRSALMATPDVTSQAAKYNDYSIVKLNVAMTDGLLLIT